MARIVIPDHQAAARNRIRVFTPGRVAAWVALGLMLLLLLQQFLLLLLVQLLLLQPLILLLRLPCCCGRPRRQTDHR